MRKSKYITTFIILVILIILVVCIWLIVFNNSPKTDNSNSGYFFGQNLTEEEKVQIISIALNDPQVLRLINNQSFCIDWVSTVRINQPVAGETPIPGQVSGVYPGVSILLGNLSLPGTKLQVLVDIKKNKSVDISVFPRKPNIVYPIPLSAGKF